MTTYSFMYDPFVFYHFIHIIEISSPQILGLLYDFVSRNSLNI